MKFDSSMVSVLVAAFIPLLVLILAIYWDRRQRKRTEKPPQTVKLLRPPGYSLSIRFEKAFDLLVDCLLAATVLSAFSGICVVFLARSLGVKAPLLFLVVGFVVAALFIAGCLWFTFRVFYGFKQEQNIKLGLRGEQPVAEALNEAATFGFRSFHDLPAEETWNIEGWFCTQGGGRLWTSF
jgi:hypothetical protein